MKKLRLQNGFIRHLSNWQKVLFLMLFGLAMTPSVMAQRTVTGTVTGADGAGVPSASIVVKGTTNGTITDLDGAFSLKVPDNAVLVISSIGLSTQEVAVGNQSVINIKLAEDAKTLGELVVIG